MAKGKSATRLGQNTIELKFTHDEMKFLRRASKLSALSVPQLCRAILGLRLASMQVGKP